jgi:GT2 family glycosyltransferase
VNADGHLVTVVIPTLGRATLAACQAALRAQTRPPDEVVVVVDEARRGISWARNQGTRQARGDLIAFTDDDCIPPPGWLAGLIGAIDAHDAAGAGGDMIESDPFLHAIRQRRNRLAGQPCSAAGNGANIMYRQSWLEACCREDGYVFNEDFRHAEDVELAWRLRRRGAMLVTVAEHVVHLRRAAPATHLWHQFRRGTGIAQLYLAQRQAGTAVIVHDSLLWGRGGVKHRPRWVALFWHKVLGPFDAGSFGNPVHYALFWLGEKFQGAGFLWGLIKER